MQDRLTSYGIEGTIAPELNVPQWVDGTGNVMPPLSLKKYRGKFKIIYCFQSWCPGCHSQGLPTLQKMVSALKDNNNIVFMAIQTVFEGKQANTYERMTEIQKEYELNIPFGHDEGDERTDNISWTMKNYRTGGTPWFIFIDQNDKVIFNDFHLNSDNAIEYLKEIN